MSSSIALIKQAVREALQDPFHQGWQDDDDGHFKEMDISEIKNWRNNTHQLHLTLVKAYSVASMPISPPTNSTPTTTNSPTRDEQSSNEIIKRYPSFDPVFMKVWTNEKSSHVRI